ncbi:MAG: hypothetical protein AWU57_3510 [Marinobacter sp. T13-3]|nr:MAG: hypothetical protein AWU57_3510 [Marinobacter sp. T13-3]
MLCRVNLTVCRYCLDLHLQEHLQKGRLASGVAEEVVQFRIEVKVRSLATVECSLGGGFLVVVQAEAHKHGLGHVYLVLRDLAVSLAQRPHHSELHFLQAIDDPALDPLHQKYGQGAANEKSR